MEATEGKMQTADPLASPKKKKKTGKAGKPHELLIVNSFSLQTR